MTFLFLLIGIILLIYGYKLLMWNFENIAMPFHKRPQVYFTKPLFGVYITATSFAMLITGFVLFWKASHIIAYIIISLIVLYIFLVVLLRSFPLRSLRVLMRFSKLYWRISNIFKKKKTLLENSEKEIERTSEENSDFQVEFEQDNLFEKKAITEDDIINAVKSKIAWEDINEFSIKDQRRLRVFLERAREKEKKRNNLKALEVIAYNIRELKNNDEDYFVLDENPNDNDLRDFLIFKYKPIIFYNQDFKFSDDIQKKMSENPFLMEGEIGKIYRKNNRNFITLSGFTGLTANNKSFFDLKFSCKLEANKKQLAYIENKTKEDDFLNNFFVVANISKFSFPEPQNNATDDETAKNIFLSSLFSMEGNLTDIIKDE